MAIPCKSVSEECRSTVLLNIASETCATEVSYKGVFPARSSRVSCSLQESHTGVIRIRACVSQESVQTQLHRGVANDLEACLAKARQTAYKTEPHKLGHTSHIFAQSGETRLRSKSVSQPQECFKRVSDRWPCPIRIRKTVF